MIQFVGAVLGRRIFLYISELEIDIPEVDASRKRARHRFARPSILYVPRKLSQKGREYRYLVLTVLIGFDWY
jgi:hypothetical protein